MKATMGKEWKGEHYGYKEEAEEEGKNNMIK